MTPITMPLTSKQASDLRLHLCIAYTHWADEARESSEPNDRLICKRMAINAWELFLLCLAADHSLEDSA